MAQGRMLKKNISTSNKLALLKTDSSRMLYVWLLPHLDIEGFYSADPDIIRGYVLTKLTDWDSHKINSCLDDMAIVGLIRLHDIGDNKYIEYPDFKKYQTLREDREAKSEIRPLLLENSGRTPALSKDKVKISKDKYNTTDTELTNYLYSLVKENYPFIVDKKTEQQWENDYEEMNRLNRLDGRDYEIVRAVIMWSQQDPFWKQNIRSVNKLREKFDQLLIKIKGATDSKVKFVS